jgi:hypothetical protein
MPQRRTSIRTTGALAVALLALTSCGFDLATNQPYQPGVGSQELSGSVKVLAAVIVAAQPNEGTLVATLVSPATDEDGGALTGAASAELTFEPFDPIDIDVRSATNLAEEGGLLVSGDFDAGDVLPVTFTFDDGDESRLNIPVVRACDEYLGLDLTEGSEFIPYDCDQEPEPVGDDEVLGEDTVGDVELE